MTLYSTSPHHRSEDAIAFVRQFGHGGGCSDPDFHLPTIEDTWEDYEDDDPDRTPPSERFWVEVSYKGGSLDRSDQETQILSKHPTETLAAQACEEAEVAAEAAALTLVTLDIPENLDPTRLTFNAKPESRDGYAYKQTATATYTDHNGNELESNYLGMTHDMDGHRLDFQHGNTQAAIDNLADHLDQWEFTEPEDKDEDPQPLTLRACYIINSEPSFHPE